jgi:hypothetical protein
MKREIKDRSRLEAVKGKARSKTKFKKAVYS